MPYPIRNAVYKPSLEELSNAIAPLLTSGTLEVVSIDSNYGQFVHLHRLSIRSDGWVQAQEQICKRSKRKNWYYCSTETFEPPQLRQLVRQDFTDVGINDA
jgi:hypothetical protein